MLSAALSQRLAPSCPNVSCGTAGAAASKITTNRRVTSTRALYLGAGPRREAVHAHAAVLDRDLTEQAVQPELNWQDQNAQFHGKSPLEVVDWALERFGDEIGIAFSGAEDVALVEYAHLTGRPYRVFSLDTGRLHPETYQLFDKVEKHYGINIEYTFPDAQETQDLVRAKGMFSFYVDGHQECCRIRKVRPLRRQLKTLKAWITGQRKDQSPGTRADIPIVQSDPAFEGIAGGPESLVKFNPLSNISSEEVWNFLRVMGVPTNVLHQRGFASIGCEPCTIPVLPHQHEREGRWAWEDATQKECGLHSGNIKGGAASNGVGPDAQQDLWEGSAHVQALTQQQMADYKQGQRDKDTLVVLYAPWCQYSQAMEPSYEQLAADHAGNSNLRIAKFQADLDREFSSQQYGLKTFPTIVFLPKNSDSIIPFPSERRDPHTLSLWLRNVASS